MSAASIIPFETLDISPASLVFQPIRNNDKSQGKSVRLDSVREDGTRGALTFRLPEVTLAWPIRPGGTGDVIRPTDRLNMEVELEEGNPEHKAVAAKARELDNFILTSSLDKKGDWFGAKASRINSVEGLMSMYTFMLKEGKTSKEGRKYNDNLRFKIDGWATAVEAVTFSEKEGAAKLPQSCTWKARPFHGPNPVTERDTQFLLFVGVNPKTGKEQYTDKVPIKVDGQIQKNDKGEVQWRYVGPQDAPKGSRLSVIVSLSKLYVTETFGPTLVAKKVYIKPAPPKKRVELENTETLADINPSVALLALEAALTSQEELEDAESVGEEPLPAAAALASTPTAASASASTAEVAADDAVASLAGAGDAEVVSPAPERLTGKKRKAEEDAEGAPTATKKSKKAAAPKPAILDEDF